MKTFVVYPKVIKRGKAHKLLDNGEIWGPLWPFLPKNKGESYWREAMSISCRLARRLKTTPNWSLAVTRLTPHSWMQANTTQGSGEQHQWLSPSESRCHGLKTRTTLAPS